MKVVIEFYRTREKDKAHAVLGRVVRLVPNLEDAVGTAWSLIETLEMPQAPDEFSISDDAGNTLIRYPVEASGSSSVTARTGRAELS